MLLEHEVIIANYLKMELELEGFDVMGFVTSGEQAVENVKTLKPDIILMDVKLTGNTDGIAAANIIHKKYNIPIIFMTAYSKLEITEKMKDINPVGCFYKPIYAEILKPVIINYFNNKILT